MLMDGRHFRLDLDGPEAVGYKALGVNLSDIAAMAGVPVAAVVAVALPRTLSGRTRPRDPSGEWLPWPNAWSRNSSAGTRMPGTAHSSSASRFLAKPRRVARFAGPERCRGDAILVTGPLGGSLPSGRHLRPQPRVLEALALHQAAPLPR